MKKILPLFSLFVFLLSSCSKDDNPGIDNELKNEVIQEFSTKISELSVPSSLASNNNEYAKQAYTQFESVKQISSSLTSFFIIPDYAVSAKMFNRGGNNSETYTWTSDGVTINYTITELADKFSFIMNITENNSTFKLADGYQKKDGSYAEINFYDGNTNSITIKFWNTNQIFKIEISNEGSKYILESNTANNSGSIKLYEDNTLYVSYIWNADGSGIATDHSTGETYTW